MAGAPMATAGETAVKKLTVDDFVSMAGERSVDTQIAKARLAHATSRRSEAFGLVLPDVDFSATYRHEGNVPKYEISPGQSLSFQPDENYSLDASLNQWIYSGAVGAGYDAAKRLEAMAENGVTAALNNAVADVKSKAFAVLLARQVISAYEDTVERAGAHHADARDREALGLATSYDVMRFATSLAEARAALIGAKNDYSRALSALLESVSMDPLEPVEVDGELVYEPLETSLEEALESARAFRPELLAARAGHEAAENIARAAKSELYPTAKLFGAYRSSNSDFRGDGSFGWRNEWNVGAKVELNLFDGAERASRVNQRLSEREIARLEMERAERLTVMEAKSAFDEFTRAKELVESQSLNVEHARETYRIVSERRRVGMATHLELLDAHGALTMAQVSHGRTLYGHAVARARLIRAMGLSAAGEKIDAKKQN
ncbi:MAG: TolC family protein [Nitrospinae bacterium]|nr:TolC family protein [Nitrospinota bacterium]